MKIVSAKFMKGIVTTDDALTDGTPQIAFVGRSNVGKSSLINTLTNTSVARTSSSAGSTQEMNLYLINKDFYFLDLPGYGFARASGRGREKIGDLIDLYLFQSGYEQKKVLLVIDANIGMTDKDTSMFEELKDHHKDIIVVFNKIDKMTQSENHHKLLEVRKTIGDTPLVQFSSKKKSGLDKLTELIFG
jgi:GTP-binding protein